MQLRARIGAHVESGELWFRGSWRKLSPKAKVWKEWLEGGTELGKLILGCLVEWVTEDKIGGWGGVLCSSGIAGTGGYIPHPTPGSKEDAEEA